MLMGSASFPLAPRLPACGRIWGKTQNHARKWTIAAQSPMAKISFNYNSNGLNRLRQLAYDYAAAIDSMSAGLLANWVFHVQCRRYACEMNKLKFTVRCL
jgi:hypothetical protein